MTNMNLRSVAALLCAFALSSCEKNGVQEIAGAPPGSSVKFYNFGVGAPGVNFYANDTKMTAVSSTSGEESNNGTNYGSVGAGAYYTAIAPGQYTLSGKIAGATDKGLAISSLSTTLADGKYYSFYQSGFYNSTTKTVDAFIVEDPFPAEPDFTVATVRFVNAISNSVPMTLYVKHQETSQEFTVGGGTAYQSAGEFVTIPAGFYDLSARTGSDPATTVISRVDVSFNPGKVYTISARGDMTVTSTTATNRPFLDNTENR